MSNRRSLSVRGLETPARVATVHLLCSPHSGLGWRRQHATKAHVRHAGVECKTAPRTWSVVDAVPGTAQNEPPLVTRLGARGSLGSCGRSGPWGLCTTPLFACCPYKSAAYQSPSIPRRCRSCRTNRSHWAGNSLPRRAPIWPSSPVSWSGK